MCLYIQVHLTTCNVFVMYLYVLVHCVAILLKSHHLYTGSLSFVYLCLLILTLSVFLCCAVSTYSCCVVFLSLSLKKTSVERSKRLADKV